MAHLFYTFIKVRVRLWRLGQGGLGANKSVCCGGSSGSAQELINNLSVNDKDQLQSKSCWESFGGGVGVVGVVVVPSDPPPSTEVRRDGRDEAYESDVNETIGTPFSPTLVQQEPPQLVSPSGRAGNGDLGSEDFLGDTLETEPKFTTLLNPEARESMEQFKKGRLEREPTTP